MATVVSMINMKGGVGKTTLCFQFAYYAARRRLPRLRVLAVDLDPQSNLSQYLMGAYDYEDHVTNDRPTIVQVFEEFAPPTGAARAPRRVRPSTVIQNVRSWAGLGRIDLIPSRLELSWSLRNAYGRDHLLARFLSRVEDDYDLILIDCAPTESMLTWAAYRASRYIVVPVKLEFLASIGLPLLARSLDDFRLQFDDQEIELAGIIYNQADPHFTKAEQ